MIVFVSILVSAKFIPSAFSQETATTSGVSGEEKLYALSLTRFHFITLKHFHSALFSLSDEKRELSNDEANILNAGLNAFLTSPERETMLLEALRKNKSVQLHLSVPEKDSAPQVVTNPKKPLLYQLKPMIHAVPVLVAIKPLLDGPLAFEITLEKGKEHSTYDVDWAGGIAGLA